MLQPLLLLPENDVRVDKVAQRSVHGLHARLSCFDSQSCCCRCYHHFFQHGSSLAARAVAVKAELEAAAAHKCVCIKRKNLPPGAGRCCALTALKPPRHQLSLSGCLNISTKLCSSADFERPLRTSRPGLGAFRAMLAPPFCSLKLRGPRVHLTVVICRSGSDWNSSCFASLLRLRKLCLALSLQCS